MPKKVKVEDQQLANINAKILELQLDLQSMDPTDDEYKSYSEALTAQLKNRNDYLESMARRVKDKMSVWDVLTKAGYAVGAITVSVIGLSLAYRMDSSDEIVRNKSTLGIVGKLFPPKRM